VYGSRRAVPGPIELLMQARLKLAAALSLLAYASGAVALLWPRRGV
jgi:hypothetical protein